MQWILGKALAQRPGRVDLAVKIPLADEACRLKLFALYSRGLEFAVPRAYAARTKGASAANICELLRQAAVAGYEVDGKLRVDERCLTSALGELAGAGGGAMTRSLLGFEGGSAANSLLP